MSALEVEDVYVSYERRGAAAVQAVAGATLSVARGEIVGLVGESGCGKSTLARATVGLVSPTSGEIRFDGQPVKGLTRRARPRELRGLQMVFQNPYSSLNPRRTVGAQLVEAISTASGNRRGKDAEVADLLDTVGLQRTAANRYPHQFSGGQRQRIAIARVLAARPAVIVLDEPLSSLDASAQAQVANLLVTLAHRLQIGLLLISHDLAIVRYVADRVCVMYLGRIVEQARSDVLWRNPRHPYTQALIDAVPRPDGAGVLPTSLPGEVPNPAAPPSGCHFHPRCPARIDGCEKEAPPLFVLPGGEAACWLRSPQFEERNGPRVCSELGEEPPVQLRPDSLETP